MKPAFFTVFVMLAVGLCVANVEASILPPTKLAPSKRDDQTAPRFDQTSQSHNQTGHGDQTHSFHQHDYNNQRLDEKEEDCKDDKQKTHGGDNGNGMPTTKTSKRGLKKDDVKPKDPKDKIEDHHDDNGQIHKRGLKKDDVKPKDPKDKVEDRHDDDGQIHKRGNDVGQRFDGNKGGKDSGRGDGTHTQQQDKNDEQHLDEKKEDCKDDTQSTHDNGGNDNGVPKTTSKRGLKNDDAKPPQGTKDELTEHRDDDGKIH